MPALVDKGIFMKVATARKYNIFYNQTTLLIFLMGILTIKTATNKMVLVLVLRFYHQHVLWPTGPFLSTTNQGAGREPGNASSQAPAMKIVAAKSILSPHGLEEAWGVY